MRRLSEIKHEMEMIDRELHNYMIKDNDADEQMLILDRRRGRLEKEYQTALLNQKV